MELAARWCLHEGVCTEEPARKGLRGSACTEGSARRGLHGSACTERAARRCLHGGHGTQNVEKQHHDHRRGTGDPCIFLRTRGVPRISLDTLVKKPRTGNGEKIKNYQSLIYSLTAESPSIVPHQSTYASSRPRAHIHAQGRFQPAHPPPARKKPATCWGWSVLCCRIGWGGRGVDGVTVVHGGVCTEVPARRCLHEGACTEVSARRCLHGGVRTEVRARKCLRGGVCTKSACTKNNTASFSKLLLAQLHERRAGDILLLGSAPLILLI